VEIYDSATLVHTLQSAIAELNQMLAAEGEAPVILEEQSLAGRTYYALHREGLGDLAVMTTIDGYMVIGPSRAVVDQAIAQRESGVNLSGSDDFRALLPDNGYTDCSALVYRDLDALLSAVPTDLLDQYELAGTLSDGLSTGLVCVFGGDDRITASATGGSLLGISSILGMAGAIGETAAPSANTDVSEERAAITGVDAVSSQG